MKKKLFFAAIIVVGMITTFNINVVEVESGDISLQNIEILSFGETGGHVGCIGTGSLDCPKNGTKSRSVW